MVGSFWYEVGRASSNYQIAHHVQHLSAMVRFESESTTYNRKSRNLQSIANQRKT